MSKEVWAYVLCALVYFVFLGPFLISAPSWIAVAIGVGLGVTMLWWFGNLIYRYLNGESKQ